MDEQTMKRAGEIAQLREESGMTFKAIGEKLGLSPSKTSYLYQALLRDRRAARYRELYAAQNQIDISLPLTLGEGVILRRIPFFYQNRVLREDSRRSSFSYLLRNDPDYATAENIQKRLFHIEHEIRRKNQEHD